MAKHGIWIGDQHEVLYDSVADELIIREIFDRKDPLLLRIPMKDVVTTYVRARKDDKRPGGAVWLPPEDRPTSSSKRTKR